MNRTERKEFLRKFLGRMPRIFGGSGCSCKSCKETDDYWNKGFDAWPKGKPTGCGAASDYAAHVRHSLRWGRSADGQLSKGPEIPDSIRRIVPEPRFPAWVTLQSVAPIAPAPQWVRDWINKNAKPWAGPRAEIVKADGSVIPCDALRLVPKTKRGLSALADKYRRAA